jgi:hypothetical protein
MEDVSLWPTPQTYACAFEILPVYGTVAQLEIYVSVGELKFFENVF